MESLSEIAKACGFDACGVVPVDILSRERERLEQWVERGFHAGMNYMANNMEKRENPALLVEGARSVIVTLTNYYTPKLQLEGVPVVARYAYGKDYHRVVKDRLFKLYACLEETIGRKIMGRVFVDSAPVFEHEWAVAVAVIVYVDGPHPGASGIAHHEAQLMLCGNVAVVVVEILPELLPAHGRSAGS